MKGIVVVTCFVLLVSLLGCTGTQKGAGIGTLVGAGAGAIIGHQSGHAGEGALIGGLGGAAAGALIGDQVDTQNEKEDRARQEGYEAGRRDAQRAGTSYQSDLR
jgi:uncharacterized protein YcfJ